MVFFIQHAIYLRLAEKRALYDTVLQELTNIRNMDPDSLGIWIQMARS